MIDSWVWDFILWGFVVCGISLAVTIVAFFVILIRSWGE